MKIHTMSCILRGIIGALFLPMLFLCCFYFPYGFYLSLTGEISLDIFQIVLIAIVYLIAVPYVLILLKSNQVLYYFQKEIYFNDKIIDYFRKISYNFGIIIILYLIAIPFLYVIADREDAPGMLLLALVGFGIIFIFHMIFAILHHIFKKLDH